MDAESRPQKRLRSHFFSSFVLQVPDAVAVRQRLEVHAALGLDAHFEPATDTVSVHSLTATPRASRRCGLMKTPSTRT